MDSTVANPSDMNSPARRISGALLLVAGGALLGLAVYRALPSPNLVFVRVKVEQETAPAAVQQRLARAGDPAFIRAEMDCIRSDAVLGEVIRQLDLVRRWGLQSTNGAASEAEAALRHLRRSLELVPVPKTSLVDIRVIDAEPGEAAMIANAVANAYQAHQRAACEQIKRSISDSVSRSVGSLEEQWKNLGRQIQEAREKLARLRMEQTLAEAEPDRADDPARTNSINELQLQLEELQLARTNLQNQFLSDATPGPAASCVNVDIVRPAVAPPGRNPREQKWNAIAIGAGMLACAGGGLLLRRPARPVTSSPAR
jgi:uncharacterized protein involved in exopolysaccharide biosynthesis